MKGFQQKQGINYTYIFSLLMKLIIIRLVLGIVAAEDLVLEQFDVKTVFLHEDLKEDIYIETARRFFRKKKDNMVCKLKRSLYSLKLLNNGIKSLTALFMRLHAGHCCYVKNYYNSYIILLLFFFYY